jgi:uncharacterized repeat protein (TIGR02543 family)
VLFNKKRTTLIIYPQNRGARLYRIPKSVKTLGSWSLVEPYGLKQLVIGSNIRNIKKYALYATWPPKNTFLFAHKLPNISKKALFTHFGAGESMGKLPVLHVYPGTRGVTHNKLWRGFSVRKNLRQWRGLAFDSCGESAVSRRSKRIGQALGALPKPTRKGYVFLGWYYAKKGGRAVTAKTLLAGDTTLYAHWKKR